MSKSTSDLREFLLETMHQVRRGDLDAVSGRSIAELGKQMIDSARLDLEFSETGVDVVRPTQIISDTEPAVIEHQGPSPDIVIAHYDDGVKPNQIATLVGSDIRTVTEIINDHK